MKLRYLIAVLAVFTVFVSFKDVLSEIILYDDQGQPVGVLIDYGFIEANSTNSTNSTIQNLETNSTSALLGLTHTNSTNSTHTAVSVYNSEIDKFMSLMGQGMLEAVVPTKVYYSGFYCTGNMYVKAVFDNSLVNIQGQNYQTVGTPGPVYAMFTRNEDGVCQPYYQALPFAHQVEAYQGDLPFDLPTRFSTRYSKGGGTVVIPLGGSN